MAYAGYFSRVGAYAGYLGRARAYAGYLSRVGAYAGYLSRVGASYFPRRPHQGANYKRRETTTRGA